MSRPEDEEVRARVSAGIRVLLLAAATSVTGGGERHVADLLRGLPARGVECVLACPAGGDLPALAASLGIPHAAIEIERGFSPGALSSLKRALRDFAPALVHAHGSRAALFARLADSRARERCVYTLHGIHIDKSAQPRRAVLLGLERTLRSRTAHFVAVCEANARHAASLGIADPARTSVIVNGIALPKARGDNGVFRAELGIAADTPLALHVGRYVEPKDHATLLRAWALARERVPEAVLALIGSGPLEGVTRALAASLGLAGSVRFLTPRPDLAPAYADADVFVLSSRWEGLPYVVLEAMAAGVPVVATAVDGVPEAVADGETGLLAPAGDAAALGAALAELLGDPARARVFGEAGRARVAERFGLETMLDATAALYAELTG